MYVCRIVRKNRDLMATAKLDFSFPWMNLIHRAGFININVLVLFFCCWNYYECIRMGVCVCKRVWIYPTFCCENNLHEKYIKNVYWHTKLKVFSSFCFVFFSTFLLWSSSLGFTLFLVEFVKKNITTKKIWEPLTLTTTTKLTFK